MRISQMTRLKLNMAMPLISYILTAFVAGFAAAATVAEVRDEVHRGRG